MVGVKCWMSKLKLEIRILRKIIPFFFYNLFFFFWHKFSSEILEAAIYSSPLKISRHTFVIKGVLTSIF